MAGTNSIGSLAGLALLALTYGCGSPNECLDCITIHDDLRDTSFAIPLSSVQCIDWEHQSFSLSDEHASIINARILKEGSRGYHASLHVGGKDIVDFDFYVYGSSYIASKTSVIVGNNRGMRTFLPPNGWLILGEPHSHLSTEQFNKLFDASTLARYRELGISIASDWNCSVQDHAPEQHPAAYDTLYNDALDQAFYQSATP